MNYKHGFIVPLILIIIAVLVIGGGAYVYEQQRPNAQSSGEKIDCAALNLPPDCNPGAKEVPPGTQNNVTGTNKVQQTTSTTQTADWKTFRSEKYAVELRYPKEWYVYDFTDGGGGIAIYERRVGPNLPSVSRSVVIGFFENVTEDVKTYAERTNPTAAEEDLLNKNQSYMTVAQTQSFQIYTKIIDRDGPSECINPSCDRAVYENVESLFVNTYIPHGSTIFEVSVNMRGQIGIDEQKKKINSEEEISYLNMYNKILSTLRFSP